MRMFKRHILLGSIVTIAAARAASAASCEDLRSLKLADIAISDARVVDAGAFTLPDPPPAGGNGPNFRDLPAFCRVTARATPSKDSDIKVEVWLPVSGWNQRFQPVGNGLWGGSLNFGGLAGMLRAGYATASSDTGHAGNNTAFAPGHPEKVIDFAYRGFHVATVLAKAAIPAYYGSQPTLSLIDQCGGAGRNALAEIQRYPNEYDIVSASGLDTESTRHSMGQLWVWQAAHRSPPDSELPREKFPIIHDAALAACDANDGIKDGVIADPLRCRFDPGVLQCKGADAPSCLTAAQVETVRRIYTPVTNPRTGQKLFGPLLPGSELGWLAQTGPEPFAYGTEFFRGFVYKDVNWHPKNRPVDFDKDAQIADSPANQIVNVSPDLSAFVNKGGKLLFVGGWSDTAIAPASNTDYYEAVVKSLGKKAENSVRLFMVPDMGHCPVAPNAANGYAVDTMSLIEQWRQTGKPPDSIVATRRVNGADQGRLLVCRYPQVAIYNGSGDAKDPANFRCTTR